MRSPVLCALVVVAALAATARAGSQTVNELITSRLKAPRGFKIEVYVDELPYARSMDLNEDGTLLYVSSYNFNGIEGTDSILSRVYGVLDSDKDGVVDEVYNITHKVRAPNGVAVHGKDMYVALMDRILKWEDAETSMKTGPTEPTLTLPTVLPNHTWHGWRYIRVHREKLYIAIGAPCNIPCDEWCDCLVNPIFGTIQELGLDGLNMKPVAEGIRNSVGIAFHPHTQDMWFTDNGRDAWDPDHSERPPDEINVVSSNSDDVPHFGYPFCYGTNIPDPTFNTGGCSNWTGAVVETATHSATLGMRFYFSDHFPAKYNGSIFYAEHGSWNSQPPHGFEVNRAYWNTATQKWERENFMSGWINSAEPEKCTSDDDCPGIATCQNNPALYDVPYYCGGWGRPADVEVLQDGSLLVSDETNHLVYRVTYVGEDDASGDDLTWTIVLIVGGVCLAIALIFVVRSVMKNKKGTESTYEQMDGSPQRS